MIRSRNCSVSFAEFRNLANREMCGLFCQKEYIYIYKYIYRTKNLFLQGENRLLVSLKIVYHANIGMWHDHNYQAPSIAWSSGLFCKKALRKQGSFAGKTKEFREPTLRLPHSDIYTCVNRLFYICTCVCVFSGK